MAATAAATTLSLLARLVGAGRPRPAVLGLHGRQVRLIAEPSDYYTTLLVRPRQPPSPPTPPRASHARPGDAGLSQHGIGAARERVVLVSLYLGTGEHEARLVDALAKALAARPQLQVHVVLDCLRALRGHARGASSVAFLAPLLAAHGPDRVRLSLYHTPDLHGWLKRLLPDRYNEVVGLQHIKAYICDDDVVLSGSATHPRPLRTPRD
jgi:hypothetical protein